MGCEEGREGREGQRRPAQDLINFRYCSGEIRFIYVAVVEREESGTKQSGLNLRSISAARTFMSFGCEVSSSERAIFCEISIMVSHCDKTRSTSFNASAHVMVAGCPGTNSAGQVVKSIAYTVAESRSKRRGCIFENVVVNGGTI